MNGYPVVSAQQAKAYKRQQIETATPEEILLLLYDGAIRFLVISKDALKRGQIEKAHMHLIQTQNIIGEFMATLNLEIGGEVSQELYRLYEYLHHRLVEANVKKDVTMIDEVLVHLRKLRATWAEAIQRAAQEKNSPAAVQE